MLLVWNIRKKGHISVNCPPKYACKIIKPKESKYKSINRETANKWDAEGTDVMKAVEFVGMVYF